MNRADPLGVVLVALAGIGFGLNGPLARVAADLGFSAVAFASLRSIASVVALLIMLAIGVAIGRARTVELRSISRLEWLQLVAMGMFVAGTTLGLFLSFERSTIALTLMLFYTYPIIVAIAAVPLYGEPLGKGRAAAIAVATIGMILLLAVPGGEVSIDPLGVVFALGAALCQTGYALVAGRGFASVPAAQSATIMRGFATVLYLLVIIPFVLLIGESASLFGPLDGAEAWLLILVAGLLSAALPTAGLIAGYRRVGPTRGAVLMLFEPLTGVVLAAFWLAERPAPAQLVGGLLVLAGAVGVQMAPGKQDGAAKVPDDD
jgi:drug/metabolite transporter (DMT)-like permease